MCRTSVQDKKSKFIQDFTGPMSNITTGEFYDGPLGTPSYIIMGVYMSVAGMTSYVGNGLILFLFIKNGLFRQTHINLFIINIVIANLGESLFGFPFAIVSNFSNRWQFGNLGCIFYGFICYTCALVVMCTYLAISIYRYHTVCKPKFLQRRLSPRHVPKILIGIWIYSLLWAAAPLVGFGSYGPEPYKTTCSLNWTSTDPVATVYMSMVIALILVVPATLMIALYIIILCRTQSQVSDGIVPEEGVQFPIRHAQHGVSVLSNIESRTTKIVFTNVIMYLVAWCPYGIMSFVAMCGVQIPIAVTTVPTMLAKSQCAYNPIIYFVAHKRFRVSLLKLFGVTSPASSPDTDNAQRLQMRTRVF